MANGGATGGRSAGTRERLLAAAGTAFAERGFHATTTRDIAAAAGMSPAAVYVHHESKEELLYLISLEGHTRTREIVREAIANADDPAGQLRAVMAAFTTFHAEQHTLARVVNYELVSLNPPHRKEIAALRRAIRRDVQSVVEAGMATGVFDTANAKLTTMALLSLGIDIGRWYGVDATWPPQTIASLYADLALRMVSANLEEKP
ncbi:MAG: TetR family transcriptional regulator [Candidatus Nanopelagicales bacterium]|nr:TetR family transcriptional regulator [Candidatus Nanopelagicales bacterium]